MFTFFKTLGGQIRAEKPNGDMQRFNGVIDVKMMMDQNKLGPSAVE